jgi:hypothetical protein
LSEAFGANEQGLTLGGIAAANRRDGTPGDVIGKAVTDSAFLMRAEHPSDRDRFGVVVAVDGIAGVGDRVGRRARGRLSLDAARCVTVTVFVAVSFFSSSPKIALTPIATRSPIAHFQNDQISQHPLMRAGALDSPDWLDEPSEHWTVDPLPLG